MGWSGGGGWFENNLLDSLAHVNFYVKIHCSVKLFI
jgi:hypothetical protein